MAGIAGLETPGVGLLLSGQPFRRSGLSAGLLSRHLGVVGRGRRSASACGGAGAAGNDRGNGLSNGSHDILAQLLVFSVVFPHKAEPLVFAHVFSADILNLLHDIKKDFLRAPVALVGGFVLAHISSGHIRSAVDGERDAVRHLLAPTVGVESRVVP